VNTGLSVAAPSFLASLVEFVEALTIVLAVGATRGWKNAGTGALAGVAALAIAVAALGPALGRIPIAALQLAVGILLLFFGMRWLRKAILRYAGVLPLHDEAAVYAATAGRLGATALPIGGRDWSAIATSFNAVALEGLEVVFIVRRRVRGSSGSLGRLRAAGSARARSGKHAQVCGRRHALGVRHVLDR
jgi:uncharacterized membrane protein